MLRILAKGVVVAVIAAGAAQAQFVPKDPTQVYRPSVEGQRATGELAPFDRAADALGMVRGVARTRTMDDVNTVEYTGAGTMAEIGPGGTLTPYAVSRMTVGISYYLRGRRVEIEREAAGGTKQTLIQVVRAEPRLAWNEEGQAGMKPTQAPGAEAERLQQLWLTPHGFMRAAVDATFKGSKVAKAGGKTVLIVPVEGVLVRATLDAKNLPERVEMPVRHPVLGATTLVAEYSDYRDFDNYGVMFPQHIVQKIGGKTVLDLKVTGFATNPYVVFPIADTLKVASAH